MMRDLVAIMPIEAARRVETTGDFQIVTAAGLAAVTTEPAAKPSVLARLMGDAKAATQALLARQKLYEHLLTGGDVLPVQPGTTMIEDAVEAFLTANTALLREQLTVLAGHVQYQLTVRWDPAAALRRFADAPEFKGCTSAQSIAVAAEALRQRQGRAFGSILDAEVSDRIDLPGDGAETVLNSVLLVPRSRISDLDMALERIDGIWTEGLRLKLVGPLPPLSFALVRVRAVDRQERSAARTRLGTDSVDPTDIDRAFRLCVKQTHTDVGGCESDMMALVEARDLLKRLAAVPLPDANASILLAEICRDGKAASGRSASGRVVELAR